jgi:hypothetical protein
MLSFGNSSQMAPALIVLEGTLFGLILLVEFDASVEEY